MASDLTERLAAIVAPLREERARVASELAELEQRRDDLRGDLTRLDQILRRANGEQKKPGRKPAARTREGYPQPKPEKIALVRAAIVEAPGEFNRDEFSATMVKTAVDLIAARERLETMSKDTVSRAVLVMHENGELRLLEIKGKTGGRMYAYLGATD